MAQPIEIILLRQLASYLATPVIITDLNDDVLFFNEAAEPLIGKRFDESERVPFEEFHKVFQTADEDGTPRKLEQTGVVIARKTGRPVHRRTRIRGFDGVRRLIEVTSVPIMGSGDHVLGVGVFLWERHEEEL